MRGVDLVRCFQQSQPLEGMLCREFYTILLDLKRDDEELLAQMKRDTRYEIKRAASKDQLVYDCRDGKDRDVFRQFCDYYDDFAAHKSQPKIDCVWLSLLADAGTLTLSRISESMGGILVWHAYHRSPHRATLLYSASLYRKDGNSNVRNKIGRANRFQHWQDMLRFKAEGLSVYDFGGWYEGPSDQERLRINRFKEEFGG